MDINEIKRILKANKKSLSDKYGITRIGIFGSYTLNLQNEKSDIDIAIEMDKKKKISIISLLLNDFSNSNLAKMLISDLNTR